MPYEQMDITMIFDGTGDIGWAYNGETMTPIYDVDEDGNQMLMGFNIKEDMLIPVIEYQGGTDGKDRLIGFELKGGDSDEPGV